jgi:hypothetical protein
MPRFRKRPVEVEAVQWTGDNEDELLAFTGGEFEKDPTPGDPDDGGVYNRHEDGHGDTWAGVSPGDWLAKGPDGPFFSIASDVLAETYEPVEALQEDLRRFTAETFGDLRSLIAEGRGRWLWERGPQEYIAPCSDSSRKVPHAAHDRDIQIESRVHCPGWPPVADSDEQGQG